MDTSTVAGASAFAQSLVSANVGTAVGVKVLDAERQAGAAALKLLSAATTGPASTAALNGVGAHVDAIA